MLFRATHFIDRRHKCKYSMLTCGELFFVSCCYSTETFLTLKNTMCECVHHHRWFSRINNNGARTASRENPVFVFPRMHEVCDGLSPVWKRPFQSLCTQRKETNISLHATEIWQRQFSHVGS